MLASTTKIPFTSFCRILLDIDDNGDPVMESDADFRSRIMASL